MLAWFTAKEAKIGFRPEEYLPISKIWELPLKGILTSLSNPYWFIWWATIGLAYLSLSLKFGIAGAVIFYLSHIMADLVWYTFVSVGVSHSRKFLAGKGYKILLYSCSIMLVFLDFTLVRLLFVVRLVKLSNA